MKTMDELKEFARSVRGWEVTLASSIDDAIQYGVVRDEEAELDPDRDDGCTVKVNWTKVWGDDDWETVADGRGELTYETGFDICLATTVAAVVRDGNIVNGYVVLGADEVIYLNRPR